MRNRFKRVPALAFATTLLASCSMMMGGFEPFTLSPQGDVFVARGVISSDAPEIVQNAIQSHPEVKTISLIFVPGSIDDEANLVASRMIREAGLRTVVPDGGFVASGGTDMFLAGVTRSIGENACLGVHSWAEVGLFSERDGSDVPKDDPMHAEYLHQYEMLGIEPDFYWFTMEVADSNSIHYLTKKEMRQYGVITTEPPAGPDVTAELCEAILMENEGIAQ